MTMEKLGQAAAFVQEKIGKAKPQIGIILGSGLGGLAGKITEPVCIPYAAVPHMKASTAPGHAGQFVVGRLGGKRVICMQGRLHYYEGHQMQEIVFPVRLMKQLGIRALIVTNAAGGVNKAFSVGDMMLIRDHINFMGTNPLIGPNEETLGERFFDMTYAYEKGLRDLAKRHAGEMGMPLQEGVYAAMMGPSFETPAEIQMLRVLGADAVGMSTVPEVIAASHMRLPVLAVSLITNMAAGVLDQPLSGEEVIEIGKQKGAQMQALVERVIEEMEA